MKTLILITLVLLTSACGKQEQFISPELQPYVDAFEKEGCARGVCAAVTHSLYFQEFPGASNDSNAVCLNKDVIYVSPTYWKVLPEYMREALVFHELGHCQFKMEHTPTGLMRHSVPSDYQTRRTEYLDNFFAPVQQKLSLALSNP